MTAAVALESHIRAENISILLKRPIRLSKLPIDLGIAVERCRVYSRKIWVLVCTVFTIASDFKSDGVDGGE